MGKSRDSAHQSSPPPRSDPGSAFDQTMDGVSSTAALDGDSATSQTLESGSPTPSKVSLGAAAQEGGARISNPMIEDSLLSATVDIPGPSKSQPPRGNSGERSGTGSLPGAAAVSHGSGLLGEMLSAGPENHDRTETPAQVVFPVANWDRYEFLSLLGQGGMGAVYKARDRRIHRIVALKFIRGGDERLTKRFLQEARSQARVEHPGICKVLEVGEVEGKAYIAMQFVDGQSLLQARAKLSLDEKILIIKEAAESLHAAHELGIIHRDIKPADVGD